MTLINSTFGFWLCIMHHRCFWHSSRYLFSYGEPISIFSLWLAHRVNLAHLVRFRMCSRVEDQIIYLERDHEWKILKLHVEHDLCYFMFLFTLMHWINYTRSPFLFITEQTKPLPGELFRLHFMKKAWFKAKIWTKCTDLFVINVQYKYDLSKLPFNWWFTIVFLKFASSSGFTERFDRPDDVSMLDHHEEGSDFSSV